MWHHLVIGDKIAVVKKKAHPAIRHGHCNLTYSIHKTKYRLFLTKSIIRKVTQMLNSQQ